MGHKTKLVGHVSHLATLLIGCMYKIPSCCVISDTQLSLFTVIFVNFSQLTFSAAEASGTMKVTVEADGFSMWHYSVEINPKEILPVGAPGKLTGCLTGDFKSLF